MTSPATAADPSDSQESPAPAPTAKKPFWKRWWFIVLVVLVALIAVNQRGGKHATTADATTAPAPTTQEETPAQAPAEEPATQAPAVEEITDEQALAEVQAFIDQRASSGIVLAKTVTSLTLADGVLTATFDPAAAGMDQATFDRLNAFPNLAKFVGTPMMSKDDQGARLRSRITRVDTVSADGRSLGSATAAELYRAGTGEDLPAS